MTNFEKPYCIFFTSTLSSFKKLYIFYMFFKKILFYRETSKNFTFDLVESLIPIIKRLISIIINLFLFLRFGPFSIPNKSEKYLWQISP